MWSPRRASEFLIVVGLVVSMASPAAIVAGPVTAYWIATSGPLLSGSGADGVVGDVMMENDSIAVVITGIGHTVSPALSGGNIIDAGSAVDRIDALGELYTYFNDSWPRQAVYSSLSILDDGSGGGPARVQAVGVDSDDSNLQVVTQYVLEADATSIKLSTTITNGGGSSYSNFELGDAFIWGSCLDFAPGAGFSPSGATSEPWVAGTSGKVVYGYAGTAGDLWGRHGNGWSDVNVLAVNLDPLDERTYERYLVVGEKDIASVATRIHELAATPVGSLSCAVRDLSGGAPLPGAEIDVFDSLNDIYLQMVAGTSGGAFTTLPAGDWRLEATQPGYASEETTLTLTLDEHAEHDFALMSDGTIPPVGDTLTVIQRPLLNIPALVRPGDVLPIRCDSDPSASGWSAALLRGGIRIPLAISEAMYDASTHLWTLTAAVPEVPLYELYDLEVSASGGIQDTTRHAVRVISQFKDDYYFIHITDTHLPTHLYYHQTGADTDTSEMEDLHAVIDDINLIHPEFVILTGDVVNEGDLEDFQNRRYYTRAQRILGELEVPVFVSSGNHDIGGWEETPVPAGTARRTWWRFFGWKSLDDPPPGAPWHTQNYSFDYGPVHYVGLEAYLNYDMWRSGIYGSESFTQGQLEWLADDLAAASGSTARVLFYHYDFSNQINLNALGVEMALWGHTHHDSDDFTPPYDICTDNVCDGARSYRLIRVANGVLQPTATVSAGADGANLHVTFDPANDGTNWTVAAQITNGLDERFEHGQLRFLMPKGGENAQVAGGTLAQVEELDSLDMYYVDVDIQPGSQQTATLTTQEPVSAPPGSLTPAEVRLDQNLPNPFDAATRLPFALPRSCPVRLEVFDIRGRLVARLIDETLPAGRHEARWDGRSLRGTLAPSGMYMVRLTAGSEAWSRKILLAR